MKKLLILCSIFLLSCTPEEEKKCYCNNAKMRIFGQMPQTNYFYTKIEIDCKTGKPINLKENYIFVGCDD